MTGLRAEAVVVLADLLDSEDPEVRLEAAMAILEAALAMRMEDLRQRADDLERRIEEASE